MAAKLAFGEANREFWSTPEFEQISKEPWIQALAQQITNHLRSNIAWMGIQESSQEGIRLLDYACGPGVASKAMLPYASEIRGVDVSDGMVERFNKQAREMGLSRAQMYAVRGNLLESSAKGPLGEQDFYGFDLAIMSMGLHHVDDPTAMVKLLVDRLKPGGTLVIIDWISSAGPSASLHQAHATDDSVKPGSEGPSGGGERKEYPGHHTVAFDGFVREQLDEYFAKAGCGSSDFVLAESPSEVPPSPSGQKHMFFAKGTRRVNA